MSEKLKTSIQELSSAKNELGGLMYDQLNQKDRIRHLQACLPTLRDNVRRAVEEAGGVPFYMFMELLQG